MKVDKTNPWHWLFLVAFALNVTIAIVLRPFRRGRSRKRVILYGHKLAGNLLAIYQHLRATRPTEVDVAFLSLDPAYCRDLSSAGESCALATSPRSISWLATADALVSDHGLHALLPMLHLSDMKFYDVWHGIPFKGFDADDFKVQRRYDEAWVASPALAKMYVERFGFDSNRVKVTGYARTDRLVRQGDDSAAIRKGLGLAGEDIGKVVLFAPTWSQDSLRRSLFPFGVEEQAFYRALSALAQRTSSTFVMRTHLNSSTGVTGHWDRIVHRPSASFPDTEALLLASDILVCDWSSIAFDYLLLDRPTIFLDVPPPFAKGLSFDADHRFGAIARDMDDLQRLLESYLADPSAYSREYGEKSRMIKTRVYAGSADGHAAERCVERLRLASKT